MVNIDFLRKIDLWVGVPLCRLLSLLPGTGGRPGPAGEVRTVLFIVLSEMGSLVLAVPMFRELRRRYPGVRIRALVFEKNRELLELLEVVPPEDVVTIDGSSAWRFFRGSLGALRAIRRARVDAVIDGELFTRVGSLFAFLSGARIRVGFHRHTQEGLYRGDFINRPVLYNPSLHITHQFLTLAAAIDSETWPAGKREVPEGLPRIPRIRFAAAELEAAQRRFAADFPGVDPGKLVLIQPGGGAIPIRAWPPGHYARLVAGLVRAGYRAGIVGPPEDRGLAREIVAAAGEPGTLDLTGWTRSLRELLLLFHLAPLLIANDGGPAQFSALTPIAAVILFGPETPGLYGSLNPRAVCIQRRFACSPCVTAYNHRKTPCDGDAQCLQGIDPELVLDKARELLAG